MKSDSKVCSLFYTKKYLNMIGIQNIICSDLMCNKDIEGQKFVCEVGRIYSL